jgi:anti-sigma regulatory factor (Ser/Thr protein kinase)
MGAQVDGMRPVRHNNQRGNLVECQTFESEDDFDDLVDMLDSRLERDGWPANVVSDVTEWLQEAADNLSTHAGGSRGFLAAQTYRRRDAMQFTIGDAGIGIAATSPRTRTVQQ